MLNQLHLMTAADALFCMHHFASKATLPLYILVTAAASSAASAAAVAAATATAAVG